MTVDRAEDQSIHLRTRYCFDCEVRAQENASIRARVRELEEALRMAHEQACRSGCATKWMTANGEESRHTEACRRARTALYRPQDNGGSNG